MVHRANQRLYWMIHLTFGHYYWMILQKNLGMTPPYYSGRGRYTKGFNDFRMGTLNQHSFLLYVYHVSTIIIVIIILIIIIMNRIFFFFWIIKLPLQLCKLSSYSDNRIAQIFLNWVHNELVISLNHNSSSTFWKLFGIVNPQLALYFPICAKVWFFPIFLTTLTLV